jgi:hypothetical protein
MRQDVNDEDDNEHERKHRAEVTKERRHDRAVVYEDQALCAGATAKAFSASLRISGAACCH